MCLSISSVTNHLYMFHSLSLTEKRQETLELHSIKAQGTDIMSPR